MDFAAAIQEARTKSGLTQGGLARKADVSPHAVWEVENRGNGTVAVLTALSSALDLRFAELPKAKSFGDQVKVLRERRGWSQETLAERAGVSAPAIMRLERGNARIRTLSAVLRVLAPGCRVRRPQVTLWGNGSRDSRFTPPEVVSRVVHVLGPIDLDPSANQESPVVAERYYYQEDDGLSQPWNGRAVYCNPPYSDASSFIRKAHESWTSGESEAIFMLLPLQPQTITFHTYVVGHADVFILKGRIAFEGPHRAKQIAPFGNMVALYGADDAMIQRMLNSFDCVHLPRTAAVGRALSRTL